MLQTVYHSVPAPSEAPHWGTEREADTNELLDMDSEAGGLFWRNVASPYWLDQNHISPGFGNLHLLAFAFNGSHGTGPKDVIGDRPYNLLGARFSFDVQAAHGYTLSKETRLIFWIQIRKAGAPPEPPPLPTDLPVWTQLPTGPNAPQLPTPPAAADSYINLGYLGHNLTIDVALGYTPAYARSGPESRTSGWVPYAVVFDPARTWEWVAYGGRASRPDYALPDSLDAAGLTAAFQRWDWNLGIHAVYGQVVPPSYDPSIGHLRLRNLKLEVESDLNEL